MNTDKQAAARELLTTVQDNVLATFPSEAEYYRGFIQRFAPQLLQTAIAALDRLTTKATEGLDAAQNNHAASLLERDVQNLADFFGRFAPELSETRYGKEIWALYAKGELTPETVLTGRFVDSTKKADVRGVLREIDAAIKEEMQRRERMQEQE